MSIKSDFFKNSRIEKNRDTDAIMDYLTSAENVNKMIVASEIGLPAITPIVKELEDRFGNSELAPLNHNGEHKNAVHRQNIGRMIKHVMSQFGYIPVDGGLNERARIPKYAKSKYFSTGAVYEKKQIANYSIDINIIQHHT